MVRFIGALLVAIVAALVVFIWMSPGIHADQGLAAAAAQARGEAKKWQTNAALVQIELTGFGFASRPSGIPDMTHAGPPRLAMFSFILSVETENQSQTCVALQTINQLT